MQRRNLDIYGNKPIPWVRALNQLKGATKKRRHEARSPRTFWLATIRPNRRPHVAAVGALWVDGSFYFTSGARTRKSRNVAANPNCVVSVSLDDIDLAVEGKATRVNDKATLRRIAKVYAAQGWPASVNDGFIVAEYSAPSAGPPPWALYKVTPETAFGVATAEPNGATRWRF